MDSHLNLSSIIILFFLQQRQHQCNEKRTIVCKMSRLIWFSSSSSCPFIFSDFHFRREMSKKGFMKKIICALASIIPSPLFLILSLFWGMIFHSLMYIHTKKLKPRLPFSDEWVCKDAFDMIWMLCCGIWKKRRNKNRLRWQVFICLFLHSSSIFHSIEIVLIGYTKSCLGI